ncbi:MAG TPA: relaxase/mobilization nuclease domain-containing protein [Anaerovoracaceae bacterium]|nr:relaxase/mobilization nuclease domain-containing protein [Anaerovoracaceae bacterium]
MVIVIHQTADTPNALLYNEQKVTEGVATYFHSSNTESSNPFLYDHNYRLNALVDIENRNTRSINKCLHISVNPSKSDSMVLDDKTIRLEIRQMMEHMGYGNQPYFVYKHKDLDRVHYHVVSTRIDKETGKKIKDNYEQEKMQRFIQGLEQKYNLKQEEPKSQLRQNDFTLNATCSDLKSRVEGIFRLLNQSAGIENETMYRDILGAFHLQINRSGRGEVVAVTNDENKTIRNPLRMSELKERIKIPETDNRPEKELVRQVEVQVTTGFKELFKKYRFCDAQNAAQELKEKGLLLFWSSESGNYKIFSPDNKIVFSNPFLIDKQLIRLDYFNMTNQDFYAIIKDYNRVLSEKFRFVSEGLIDYEKVSMLELKNPETNIPLKEIKLSESKDFNRITSGMDDLSKSFTESAIKDYYRYSIRRIIETEQRINQYDFYREYNQSRQSFKPGFTKDLAAKYNVVKTEDQYYLNNHPSGIQEVSLNPEQLKYHLDVNNFFSKPILEIVRLMPWYSKEKEQNKKKKMLKQKRKGQGRRF